MYNIVKPKTAINLGLLALVLFSDRTEVFNWVSVTGMLKVLLGKIIGKVS